MAHTTSLKPITRSLVGFIRQPFSNRIRRQKKAISLQRFIKQTTRKDTIWSQPYRINGTSKVASGTLYDGQQADIIAEATTTKGAYYQFKVNNKTIGWMDKRAFVDEEKTVVKAVNLDRYIDQTGRVDKIYSRPNGLLNVTTVENATTYHYQKVKVIAETTTSKGNFYQFSYNNKTIGWLAKQAFVSASDILSHKTLSSDRFISLPNKDYAVATQPYKAIGYQKLSAGKKYEGQQVHIIQQATTKNGLYYQFQINGKTIGWMFHKAFVPEEKITIKTVNLTKYIDQSSRADKIYSRPNGLLNVTTVRNAKIYHYQKVKVIAETTTSKGTFYQFSSNNKTIGWLAKQAFVTPKVSSEKTVSFERYISLPVRDYAVATLPYKEVGYKKLSAGKPYLNKKVTVIKQATTKNGLYYQFQLNGKTIGWMYHKAFVTTEPLSIKPIKRTLFIDQSNRKDTIYSQPNGQLKTQVLAKASSYHLKKVSVSAETTTSNGTFYQFTYNNKIIGWVLKQAFVAPQVTAEKQVSFNRTVVINGRDYAVATLPYKEYGYKKLNSGKKYQAKKSPYHQTSHY
ncbi:GW dipeptide domain-containing protein [Brochothrix campestris]|uniref:GW dipeptide domain-containing protein n=1 Tax=Brochothrix campestris TaxID=2757 RepID=UPI001E28607D|nr:GW domain-containing glycosaminoglycan-binding protein [Brochothrix campestris]